jgi:hypothetical protein
MSAVVGLIGEDVWTGTGGMVRTTLLSGNC